MTCAACGSEIGSGAKFCSVCGRATEVPVAAAAPGVAKQLVRPRVGRKIAGVCAGIALYTGWDLTIVRLVAVLAVLFGVGTPVLAYVIAWIVIPDGPWVVPGAGTGATL